MQPDITHAVRPYLTLTTKLLAGFAAIALLFLAVVVANYQLSGRVLTISRRVADSQYLSGRANAYYRSIVDMETGFRGYLLTGREESLEPYYEGQRQALNLEEELRRQLLDSAQQVRLLHANNYLEQWHRWAQVVIAEKRALLRHNPEHSGLDGLAHREMIRELRLKRVMDEVRRSLQGFYEYESRRRAAHTEQLNEAVRETRTASILLTVAGIGLGLLGAAYLIRLLTSRIRRQVAWAERLAAGDYSARVRDQAGDELTALSEALDTMADNLTTNIAQLETRNRELDQFAYIVSHDLKAPLRGLESVSRWIEEDYGQTDVPPHIREFLALMRGRVHRMENLISGILALSRVGRAAESTEPVAVRDLLAEILEDLTPPAGLQVQLPTELPTLRTSRTALRQVLQNLLSNAIKYHPHPETGNITVTWRQAPAHHVFTITDDGAGIAPEYHERIFQIFQTLNERDSVESTGVGLTIVRKIVERHGGTVSVASAEGRGAAFTFTWLREALPAAAGEPGT